MHVPEVASEELDFGRTHRLAQTDTDTDTRTVSLRAKESALVTTLSRAFGREKKNSNLMALIKI
jgi:hypothetical protein